MSNQTHALAAPYPHLNVVLCCSLLRVRNSLEASLANIEMGVPGALLDSVGSKFCRLSRYTPRSTVATPAQPHQSGTPTAPDGKAKLHQTGKPNTRGGQANSTRRASQTHQNRTQIAAEGHASKTSRESQPRQTGKPNTPDGQANRTRRASQPHQTGRPAAPDGQANRARWVNLPF